MKFFIILIGTIMIIEGIPYFVSPKGMKTYLNKISQMPDKELRTLGLFAMLVGLLVVYAAS